MDRNDEFKDQNHNEDQNETFKQEREEKRNGIGKFDIGEEEPMPRSVYQKNGKRKRKKKNTLLFTLTFFNIILCSFLLGTFVTKNFFINEEVVTVIKDETKNVERVNEIRPTQLISKIVKEKGDAVVSITTESITKIPEYSFEDSFFYGYGVPKQEESTSSLGSGFIFDERGFILTNQHVINDSKKIEVLVSGYEKPFIAKVIGEDKELDLAVLKIETDKKLPILKFGDINKTNVGDWSIAIGNPYGLDHTVTVGVVSAKNRPLSIGESSFENLILYLLQ